MNGDPVLTNYLQYYMCPVDGVSGLISLDVLMQACLLVFNDILLVTLRDGVIYSVIESPFTLHRMTVQEMGGAEGASQSHTCRQMQE